jgi:hypothetical protein
VGTIRLPLLPRTRRWGEVINLAGEGAGSAPAIAAATLDAADESFVAHAEDAGLVRAVWLLANLPVAARSGDFAAALHELGIKASGTSAVAELTSGLAQALDGYLSGSGKRTDLGEMAIGAAVEALASNLTHSTATLFPGGDDVAHGVAKLATEVQFGRLARDFFARLTRRSLAYYLDRELSRHVGGDRRFKTVAEQKAFNEALDLHCHQAARIVEAFAGGWWSKARFERDLSEDRTRRFVSYALKKLRDELRRGSPA